jgi:hypothetical protein
MSLSPSGATICNCKKVAPNAHDLVMKDLEKHRFELKSSQRPTNEAGDFLRSESNIDISKYISHLYIIGDSGGRWSYYG